MQYRKLGNTDIEISAVAFGAWAIGGWMWGGNDKADSIRAMHCAFDSGITSFDTAPVYGFGLSESLVGEALAGKRDQVQLFTKFGLRWDTEQGEYYFDTEDANGKTLKIYKFAGKESIIKECEASLRRLRTDYIDLYQIHWPDASTPISETMEAVQKLMQDGKIRAAGVCNYSAEQVEEACKTVGLASNQIPFSMVKRDYEAAELPQAIEKGISILAYSPLQRGLLTGKLSADRSFNKGDHREGNAYFTPKNIERVNAFLAKIKPIADDHSATLSQLVIAWTLARPGITCALVGARNDQQTQQNAQAGDLSLNQDEVGQIDRALEQLQLDL